MAIDNEGARDPVADAIARAAKAAAGESPARAWSAPSGAAAVAFGCQGLKLSDAERTFFRAAQPWGFILFKRNVSTPNQLRRLTADLRDAVGWRAPILIDQEGGRVARLKPPHWRGWPPVGDWCTLADRGRWTEDRLLEALAMRYRLIAEELADIGVDVNCAPLLDLRLRGAHRIIGDRALGAEPAKVAERGEAVCEALLAGGVLPVVKHMPGHGRAGVDSHERLPRVTAPRRVLSASDFAPFRALRGRPIGMTAHVVYADLDPDKPATLSRRVIDDVVRGEIGFEGLLITDDISMGALSGRMRDRTAESLAAGCDIVLHCNGDAAEMEAVMEGAAPLEGAARRRAEAALMLRGQPDPIDRHAALERLSALVDRG